MAKVLITPLGVGSFEKDVPKREYRKAVYCFENTGEKFETSFVAAALIKKLKVDKVIFIGTGKSMWEEVYKYFTEDHGLDYDEDYWIELGEKIDNSNHKHCEVNEADLKNVNEAIDKYLKFINPNATGGSECIIMKYGINEEELWSNMDIFMGIEEKLGDGDSIYLDITHSFRSIPLFMYLMMDFMLILSKKRINLDGVYYGMLDIRSEKGYAPIIDLAPLFKLSQWIKGNYDFVSYGNGYLIADLLKEYGNDETVKKINNVSDLININYLPELKTQLVSLQKLIQRTDSNSSGIFRYIAPRLQEFIDRFINIESDFKFQLEISKWYFENKRYSHGYICLLESILSGLGGIYGIDTKNVYNRNIIRTLLNKTQFHRKSSDLFKLFKTYDAVNNIRIKIAHAAMEELDGSFANDIKLTDKYYEEVENFFDKGILNDLPQIISIEEIKAEMKK